MIMMMILPQSSVSLLNFPRIDKLVEFSFFSLPVPEIFAGMDVSFYLRL